MNKILKNRELFLLVPGYLILFFLGHSSWKQIALYVHKLTDLSHT